MQANLRLPGAIARLRAAVGATRVVTIMPGRLDQEATGVAVACLGDAPAMLLLSRGVLAGRDPQVAGQLAWVREAIEVADLRDQAKRGTRGDPAEGAQRRDPL